MINKRPTRKEDIQYSPGFPRIQTFHLLHMKPGDNVWINLIPDDVALESPGGKWKEFPMQGEIDDIDDWNWPIDFQFPEIVGTVEAVYPSLGMLVLLDRDNSAVFEFSIHEYYEAELVACTRKEDN